jgi:hypothetical protein
MRLKLTGGRRTRPVVFDVCKTFDDEITKCVDKPVNMFGTFNVII